MLGVEKLLEIVLKDPLIDRTLYTLLEASHHDLWLGGGAIRNRIWDHIFGTEGTHFEMDLDIIYLNKSEDQDNEILKALKGIDSKLPWSVKEQYRITEKISHVKVASVGSSLSTWVETCTAVAIRLDRGGKIHIWAPFGIDDLFAGIIRPTHPNKLIAMDKRIKEKRWLDKWPGLRVLES